VLPLVRSARVSALVSSLVIALMGAVGGAVRLLPWLLDPGVARSAVAPFARGLLAVTLEAALVIGWPIGWALACFRAVESGEALVLQSLGERPFETVRRLGPQGGALALVLALAALVCGSDANAPGRVANELVAAARTSCAKVEAPLTFVVPFTKLTWLCAPDREPRLVGALPGAMGAVAMTARGAHISGDFRAIELDDARVTLPIGAELEPRSPGMALHVRTLTMHGMAPWAQASTLAPALRSLLLAVSAWSTASVAAYGVLRRSVGARSGAILLGACGPLTALGVLRWLERSGAHSLAFVLVPMCAGFCAAATAALLWRLRAAQAKVIRRRRWSGGTCES
jgi:hypothetical protein